MEARREESRHRVVHCPFDHSAVSLQQSWLLSHGRVTRGEEPLSLRTALGWADRPTIYLLSSSWLLPLSGQDHLHKAWTPLYFWAVFFCPLQPASKTARTPVSSDKSTHEAGVIEDSSTMSITEAVLVWSSVPGRLNSMAIIASALQPWR